MSETAGSTARAPFHGSLELVFAPGPRGTVLAHAHVTAPLKIVRPFALDGGRALVQMLTLGPGLCAGDRYTIDVTVQPGASAVVIAQSATRVLGMPDSADARQSVRLTVSAGGQLEYYPGLTIPFAGSSFLQRVEAHVHPGARLGILESWSTGRISRGEHLRFRRISSRTTVSVNGSPAYADALELEPARADVAGTGILEGYRYVASGVWYGATLDPSEPESASDGVLTAIGHSTPDQVYLRALAMDGYALGVALQAAVRRVNTGWGLEPIPLRRFTS
ncbi:MAG: urease accessory protein UreD [Acidobacteriota bacterium]